MFSQLLRFEFSYQLMQFTFLAFSVIFFALGLFQGSRGYASALVDFNAPYQIFFNVSLATIGCEFIIMFFVVSGMLRDRKYKMESIVYSTSVAKEQYFWSRFLGVFVLSLMAFSMYLVGFAVGTFMPGVDAERIAPFDLSTYLWTWTVVVLPNVFICTAVLFSIATFTKNNVSIYVSAVLIYFLYIFCSMYFNSPMMARSVPTSPENMKYLALLDPFGISAFFEQTQYWTPAQKNSQSIELKGWFLWNRVAWTVIAGMILGVSYYLFSFKSSGKKTKKAKKVTVEKYQSKRYQPVENLHFNARSNWSRYKSLLKIEWANIYKSLPFLVLLTVWILITFITIYERVKQGGDYNDSLYPTTNFLIQITRDPVMSLLLVVFFSGEVIWKVRELRFNGIVDATPTSNTVFYLSKITVLFFLPIIIIASNIVVSIGFQVGTGYFDIDWSQYVASFYFSGMEFVFYIFLSLFVQTVVGHKYVGILVTFLITLLFTYPVASSLGLEHPLLLLGNLPVVGYTNMNGYGYLTKSFHYFSIYWTALGLILALVSFKMWQRGSVEKLSYRLSHVFHNWKRWERLSLVLLSVVFLSTGSTIYYNTNVLTEYQSSTERLDLKEAYERKYKPLESLEKLTVVDVKTEMDIFPKQGKYNVKVDYILENLNEVPVKQVFVTERMPLERATLENARLVAYDSIHDTRLFTLDKPLQPGEQIGLSFELTDQVKGFETSKSIVENGSYISQHRFKPMLGYRKSIEIKDEYERKKRGLPKREEEKATDDHIHHHQHHKAVPIQFETIISTHRDQTAIAPGDLIKQWTANGRNYFHYKSSQKIAEAINYFSAEYETKTTEHKGVTIEQYYHPGHEYNIQNTEESTQLALDYCSEQFGSYPFDHIRIAEIPSHWIFGGQAMPGTISMVEDRFYLIDNTDPQRFDLVAKRTIHEVAHQWWGMLLQPKIIEGGSLLTEGFAKYTEAVVMEKKYGPKAIWQLSNTANQRYFSSRSYATEKEPPLCYTGGEDYLSYGKSLISMLALKDLVGEDKVNQVLRGLVEKHRDDVEPTATSLEFLEDVYKVSPPEYHNLIDDWFKRVITYDLKIEEATVRQKDDNSYEVTVEVSAQRFEVQKDGQPQKIDINEPIPFGVFRKHPKNIRQAESILYLDPLQVTQDKMTFTILTKEEPAFIAIDPFGTRLEENRGDNVMELGSE